MKRGSLSTFLAMAVLAGAAMPGAFGPVSRPLAMRDCDEPQPNDRDDPERMAAAERKRARKAAKRLAELARERAR